jgi:very-short-patch-repair endonuclease
MPEPVETWWRRRQFSRSAPVPYAIGTYREEWSAWPVLIRQYHPDLNHGIVLTQVPPAADVYLQWQCDAGHLFVATPAEQRSRPGRSRRRSEWCPECASVSGARTTSRKRSKPVCGKTPDLPVGTAFLSECAPRPASAVEASLRQRLETKLEFTGGLNAVRVARPFFDHVEVWPDIVLPEFKTVIEYDSIGKEGLSHIGKREEADRRKDRALRQAGWEVIRVRSGKLRELGPYDVVGGDSNRTAERVLDALRLARGALYVDCYLRE